MPLTLEADDQLKRLVGGLHAKDSFLLAAAILAASSANAQQTVKVGLIMAYSASSPIPRRRWITASSCTSNTWRHRCRQEDRDHPQGYGRSESGRRQATGAGLVVRDQVDVLAGFTLTPEALGAGDVSAEAKKLMVVMNAATSIITTKSPYIAHRR
jgi:branched-chain amino acid transport system substrate-binding protein